MDKVTAYMKLIPSENEGLKEPEIGMVIGNVEVTHVLEFCDEWHIYGNYITEE